MLSDDDNDEIQYRFTPQPTTKEQHGRLQCIRDASIAMTEAVREHCPPGRLRDLAEAQIELASMAAVKSITHTDT